MEAAAYVKTYVDIAIEFPEVLPLFSDQRHLHQEYLQSACRSAEGNDWVSAAVSIARAIQLAPSPALLIQYGHMLKEAGFLDAAVNAYCAALSLDGTATDGYVHLAHLFKRLGRPQDALQAFKALDAIPYAPHVKPEIDGLVVAQLNASRFELRDDRSTLPSMPEGLREQDEALHTWLRLQKKLRDENSRQRTAKFGIGRMVPRKKSLSSVFEPMADLVVENGMYRATTKNPRMRLRLLDGWEVSDLAGKWIEVTLKITESECFADPLLFIEEYPAWAKFKTVGFKKRVDNVFYAITRLPHQVVSVRLDPVHSRGRFLLPHLQASHLSPFSVMARMLSDRHSAGIGALIWAMSHGDLELMVQKHFEVSMTDQYARWIAIQEHICGPATPSLSGKGDIGFVTLIGNEHKKTFCETLASLHQQTSARWKAVLVLDEMASKSLRMAVEQEASKYDRVAVIFVPPATSRANQITAGTNALATTYVGLLPAGDCLSPLAIEEWLQYVAANPSAKIIYCDHDVIDETGRRNSPCFKPDWNSDYIHCYDYVGTSVIFSRLAVEALGGWRDRYSGLETYDLLLRVAGATSAKEEIGHVTKPLWHCRSGEKAKAIVDVVNDAFLNGNSERLAEHGRIPGTAKVNWPMPIVPPHVTIIIPTRDRIDLLDTAVKSILSKTEYPSFDIIVVDNGSTRSESRQYFSEIAKTGQASIIRDEGPFNFSRLNNHAAKRATGSVLALVNNDVEVKDGNWLREMVPIALDPKVGAVGAKLLYGSGHVQHAGMLGGVGATAAHGHKYSSEDDNGYMNRLIVQQTVLAVTAACLVVESRKYQAVGGLDEENLSVAFNDVDLCLKLTKHGWRCVFTPWAALYHHESLSRGLDLSGPQAERFRKEAKYITAKWGDQIVKDPFYNPNLTRAHEDFSLRFD